MATPPKYPPTAAPIANPNDGFHVDRTWLLFFQSLISQAAAAGSVTHTGGLTLNELLLGNGGADLKALGSYGNAGDVLVSQGAGLPPAFVAATSVSIPYMPLTLGDEPPTFVTDGAGRLIMLAFTP